jgi:hypothetical protein
LITACLHQDVNHVTSVAAQTNLQNQVRQDFAMFQSPDAEQRAAAFYHLTRIGCPACQQSAFQVLDGLQNAIHFGAVDKDVLAQNLISLLSDEAAQQDAAKLPQTYYDYLGDLVQAVSFLRDTRNRPRSGVEAGI